MDIVVFHHAQGLTPGIEAFADALRSEGHRVIAPDLYDGSTFDSLDAGVAHAESLGFDTIIERGMAAAAEVSSDAVYVGFSLGVMPAQRLAQTRPGARGAILLHASVPLEYFGPWPEHVRLQLHVMEGDVRGDVDVARELASTIPRAELHLYAGDAHLFTDSSLGEFDADAARLVMNRVLAFVREVS